MQHHNVQYILKRVMLLTNQTKSLSIQESLNGALVGAPTAIGLHKLLTLVWGDCVLFESDCNDIYLSLTWFAFFLHSFVWRVLTRIVYEKYHTNLDVFHIIRKIWSKIR